MKIWWKGTPYIMRYTNNCLTLINIINDLNDELIVLMFWGWIDTINYDKIVFHGFSKPNMFTEEVVHLVLHTVEVSNG